MSNSLALLAALGGMTIVALFNTFVFNMARTSPDNILVRSDLLASMTALVMTSTIVFSLAFVVAKTFAVTGNLWVSLATSVVAFVALSFLAWLVFGTKNTANRTAPLAAKTLGAA